VWNVVCVFVSKCPPSPEKSVQGMGEVEMMHLIEIPQLENTST